MAKSPWIQHLMQTRKNMPKGSSLGDAMKAAKKTYKKMSKSIISGGDGTETNADPNAVKPASGHVPDTTTKGGAKTCRGRSLAQCYHDKRHCKYARGTKRQFCRRRTSRNSRKSRK
jgi:hypothetical protein